MRSIVLASMAAALLLAGCGVLPPDNSDSVEIRRTVPSGG